MAPIMLRSNGVKLGMRTMKRMHTVGMRMMKIMAQLYPATAKHVQRHATEVLRQGEFLFKLLQKGGRDLFL